MHAKNEKRMKDETWGIVKIEREEIRDWQTTRRRKQKIAGEEDRDGKTRSTEMRRRRKNRVYIYSYILM